MRTFLLGCAALLTAATPALADDSSDWQTVTLPRGVTMDVPAGIGPHYRPSAENAQKGDLMYFYAQTDDFGSMSCLLSYGAYTKTFTRAKAVERLADRDRNIMCDPGEGTTGADTGESESLSISGYPAGRCATAYTDPTDKGPGQVTATMTVAAPDGFYMLSCTVHAETQSHATSLWMSQWSKIVHHIQESEKFTGRNK